MMSLSHHEQRALDQIAADLCGEDPWLASTLAGDGWSVRSWRRRLTAAVMFIAGLAMLSCAIFVSHSIPGGVLITAVLGYLIMFHAALRWFTRPLPRRRWRKFGRGTSIRDG